ncbi:Hypothetical protein FKW44_018124, partial [Caligus rogercresseyi]
YECQINCNSITLTSGFAGDGSVGWVDGAQDLKFPLSLTPVQQTQTPLCNVNV